HQLMSGNTTLIRGFLFQKIPPNAKVSPHAVGRALQKYKDKWVILGEEKLVLRISEDRHAKKDLYYVERGPAQAQVTDTQPTGARAEPAEPAEPVAPPAKPKQSRRQANTYKPWK